MTGPPYALLPSFATHLTFLSLPSSTFHSLGMPLSSALTMCRCGVPPNRGLSLPTLPTTFASAFAVSSLPRSTSQQSGVSAGSIFLAAEAFLGPGGVSSEASRPHPATATARPTHRTATNRRRPTNIACPSLQRLRARVALQEK